MSTRGISSAFLPFTIAVVLALAVHLSWAVSLALEHVTACFTYFDGCTSISRASRNEPEIYIYRALITTTGVLLVPYWCMTASWHRLVAPGTSEDTLRRLFVVFGVAAAVGLVINAALLGTDIRWAIRLRRICVLVFFIGTFASAAMVSISLLRAVRGAPHLRKHVRVMGGTLALMAAMGAVNYIVMPMSETMTAAKSSIENIIEWHYVALLSVFFAASGFAWRASGLRTHLSVSS